MLSFQKVSFTYAPLSPKQKRQGIEPQYALNQVTFDVKPGEFFGIAGHTGSGKSTLAKLTNGLISPSEGAVLYQGVDLRDKTLVTTICGTVGLVFQNPEQQLFAPTVYEDVVFGPKNLNIPEEEWEMRVANALSQVGLDFETYKDVSPFALSGGQQRRVALAGTLAMNPEVLVFDEPTAGLDPQ
ncbi:MAG: ATP-binding cassette domain-containing protein, partial [Anaerotardibacter sp.]